MKDERFIETVKELVSMFPKTIIALHVGDFCEFYGRRARAAGHDIGLVVFRRSGLWMFGLPWDDPERQLVYNRLCIAGYSVANIEYR